MISSSQSEPLSLLQLCNGIQSAVRRGVAGQHWVVAEFIKISKGYGRGQRYIDLAEQSESGSIVAKINAIMWANEARNIAHKLGSDAANIVKPGVKALLLLSVDYTPQYGLRANILDIDPNFALGELERKKRETIKKLTDDGILRLNGELPLKPVLQTIALVGSPQTSGYRDFMNQLQMNKYGYDFTIVPFDSLVQGESAEQLLIDALDKADSYPFDCIVVLRGGGSKLDLEVFNALRLCVRATQLTVPLLTGIGHEDDLSVLDMVAHKHLKTPTAVAEFILHRSMEFESEMIRNTLRIAKLAQQMTKQSELLISNTYNHVARSAQGLVATQNNMLLSILKGVESLSRTYIAEQHSALFRGLSTINGITNRKLALENEAISELKGLVKEGAHRKINTQEHKLTAIQTTAQLHIKSHLRRQTERLKSISGKIDLVHPKNTLRRGFSITRVDGKAVNPAKIKAGDNIETETYSSIISSTVDDIKDKEDGRES